MKRTFAKVLRSACLFTSIFVCSISSTAMAQSGSLFNRIVAAPSQNNQTSLRPALPNVGNDQQQANVRDGVKIQPNSANGGFVPIVNQGNAVPVNNVVPAGANEGVGANAPGPQSMYTFMPPVSTRTLKLHDIVSIRVEEAGQMLAAGNTTSRKTTNYDAVLQDWIRLVGLDTLKPAPQSDGDPRGRVNQNEVYRGDSTMRLNESLTLNIAAEITDILPNGTLVLTANKKIRVNDNRFTATLSGTCRPQDITPDNVVLSRNILNLEIDKVDSGHVRDGYSRGWLTRWFAWVKPF